MRIGRRLFIRGGLALAALATLPRTLLAMAWPEKAFASDQASQAMLELFGTNQATPTDLISLGAPEIAENGAVVPISVETSPVTAVVKTDSGLFSATKEVKVTIGGCGG